MSWSSASIVIILVIISGSESGRGGHRSGHLPHDVKTQSGLTGIYNQRVTKVEHVTRPMGSSGGSANIPFVHHHGVVATTENGNRYLVHKGNGYGGAGGDTVVTDARHMSSKWRTTDTRSVAGHTVSDFVKAGGTKYSLLGNNCIHSANRMTRLGKRLK